MQPDGDPMGSRRSTWQSTGQALAGLILVLLSSSPALAASRQTQEKEARKACLNGDFAQGVSILSDLFISTKNPTYLFNQGRCLEQNRKYEEAIARFEEYLRAAETGKFKLKSSDKEQAHRRIGKCKELLAEQEARTIAPPQTFAPPVAPVAPQPQPEAAPAPIVVNVPAPAPAEESRRNSGLLIGGIITAALGAGATVTGVILNVKANGMLDDMYGKQNGYSSDDESTRKTYETLAWVGYGVGGACLLTGAVLIWFGARSDSRPPSQVALVPTLGAGQAGLVLSGGF